MGAGPLGFALDANGGERLVFGDVTVLVRASAETTRGAFTVIEELPPMVDTPLHVHAKEYEMFCVSGEGRLLVLTSPAGFEGFFRELAEADRAGQLGPDAYAAASKRYGITWLD